MNFTSAGPFLDAVFEWTWRTSLHASVLIVLVCLIQLAVGKWLAPRWRYALGMLILVRLILPAVPASAFSIFNLGIGVLPAGPRTEPGLVSLPPVTQTQTPTLPAAHESIAPLSAGGVEQSSDWLAAARVLWLFGLAVSLVTVWRKQRKFARYISAMPPVDEERILSLLESCKSVMGVRRHIKVVIAPKPGAPALFGFLKPRFLLPESAMRNLDDRELRMIFLHELTHVKRGDILLNWIIILARSLHWFNPLAWLAIRRLRADRELVCDAMVMSRIAAAERRVYGNTLIKLLDDFSDSRFCPSLAPIINHKHEIKRRVTMIAQFKPTSRIGFLFSAAILIALCCLTFTRAAEKKGASSGNAKSNRIAESNPADERTQSSAQVRIENLKKQLQENNEEVLKAQDRTDQLRKELRISDASAEGTSLATGPIVWNSETIRRLEAARIEVDSQYQGLNSLVRLLKAKSEAELQKMIDVAVPDVVLTSLLKAKAENEQRLANLSAKFGPENPEVKGLREENRKVSDQIAERVQGILAGLQLKAEAMQTQMEELYRAVDAAKARDIDLAAKYRPYFEAKRSLENLKMIRDAISLRIEQERMDANATLPGRKP